MDHPYISQVYQCRPLHGHSLACRQQFLWEGSHIISDNVLTKALSPWVRGAVGNVDTQTILLQQLSW